MEKVRLLGISGSPRKVGNTATMVKFALEWAETLGYVETEFLSLADYKLTPCTGCMKCFGWRAKVEDGYKCYDSDDDIKILGPKVAQCDGLLIGFPVYAGGEPGILRILMEKLHHFGPMSFTEWSGGLRWKAMAVISQGGQVYGGQEYNWASFTRIAAGLGMYNVTAWPSTDAPMPSSSFIGGMLTTVDATQIYHKHAWKKESTRTVPPAQGSRNERTLKNLGRQLAVAAMTLKLGRKAFTEGEYKEPDLIAFTSYSLKPAKGSYLEKLMEEGKVKYLSREDIDERKKKFKGE